MIKPFSFSKINTYKLCPQKYKINYIDKVYKKCESIEAFMGKRVHEVIEWTYLSKEQLGDFCTVDSLLNQYNLIWDNKWHDNIYLAQQKYTIVKKNNRKFKHYISLDRNKQIFKDIGSQCLVNFYKRYIKGFSQNTIGVELRYTVNINGQKFNCIIDRLDKKDDGTYIIYDYKTSKNTISFPKANNDLQLSLYQLAIESFHRDCKKVVLKWYYLRTDQIVTVQHQKEKIDKLKNKIIDLTLKIKSDKEFEAKKSLLCNWCYFWDECEVMSTINPAKKF